MSLGSIRRGSCSGPLVNHLDAQARSGLSVSAYCLREGISLSTFYYRRRRALEQGQLSAASPAVGHESSFVEVCQLAAQPFYRLVLRGGRGLEIPVGYVGQELGSLIAIAEGGTGC